MANKFTTFLYHLSSPFRNISRTIYQYLKASKLARILIIIVIVKMLVFHGLFKSYLFPKYFKPKWDSKEHRIDDVIQHIVPEPKNEQK